MTTPVSLQSQDSEFDDQGFEMVKADLVALAQSFSNSQTYHFTGSDRIHIPLKGSARIYCISDTATAGSTGAAYHIVKILRSGQDETGMSLDTRNAEIPAYTEQFLGQLSVSKGTMLKLSVAVTGAPVPTLSTTNFAIRCDVTPKV